MTEYDFIIVGAGSAGCALAYRLSADPDIKVLLLEAGGSDNSIFIQMPGAFFMNLKRAAVNWNYETEPEPYLGGRVVACPRGKVLGGSSSLNGMAYVRGHALDFERWAGNRLPTWLARHQRVSAGRFWHHGAIHPSRPALEYCQCLSKAGPIETQSHHPYSLPHHKNLDGWTAGDRSGSDNRRAG